MSESADWQQRISTVLALPLNVYIGLAWEGSEGGVARTSFVVKQEHLALGSLHAAMLYAAMEATCLFALSPAMGKEDHAVTHDFHASVMRKIGLGDTCEIEARVVKHGRSLAFVDASATAAGKLVAAARVTKSIV
ncbi:PaaI family thioesterase [Cupriavidus sp. 8B]